jgi:hypothetical protein
MPSLEGSAMLGRLAVFAALISMTFTAEASAADLTVAPEPAAPVALAPGWRFQATLYGWATGLSGESGVGRLPDANIDTSFTDVLSNLQGAFMGAFIARNGTFILGADLIWAKLGDDVNLKEGTGPLAPFRSGANVDFDVTQTIATAFGGLRLPIGPPNLELYATAGARYQRIDTSLTLELPAVGFSHDNERTEEWVDPLVGLAMQYEINDKWFINGLADIGGFGIGAKVDTQGLLSVGYRWTPTVATTLGFRALYTDYSSGSGPGSFRYKATLYGPFAGLSLTF